jgi:hypothetical protein
MADNKAVSYLNKDFSVFKQELINYAKTYYPSNYNDFSATSPGMMFMEMASYVGDVLSFYLDNQIQENFIQYARQTSNIYSLAYMLGYKPKVISPATVEVSFYQQLPAVLSGSIMVPDFSYSLKLAPNAIVGSTLVSSQPFLVQDSLDFSYSSSIDPTEISVYSVSNGVPTYFLLKKTRKAVSALVQSQTFTFGSPQQFQTVSINANNIIKILNAFDSQGNEWYEVDYLAQDTVFDSIKNTNVNDPNFSSDNQDVPYLLKLKQVPRRFATRFTSPSALQIQFGSGTVNDRDETIVPNPDNVGIGLPFEETKLTTAFSPNNFMFTDSYGISPANTTVTFNYLTGGGFTSNVQANTITSLASPNLVTFNNSNLNSSTSQYVFNSFSLNNLEAASGGSTGDTLETIRQNSVAQFQSQLRTVTEYDYLVRALSLPAQYGTIAKALTTPKKASSVSETERISSIDLYVLSYDRNNRLVIPSTTLKNNLKTYLSQYRMINDTVDIKDGYIINIGVEFEIVVLPNFISNDVILRCVQGLQDFFRITNWQFNQPIIMRDLYILLDKIEGVQTVKSIEITNKAGENAGYSRFGYDVKGATVNNVIYPSIDPSVFEVKYPDLDIKGRVVSY